MQTSGKKVQTHTLGESGQIVQGPIDESMDPGGQALQGRGAFFNP